MIIVNILFFTAHMIRASMNSIMKIDLTGTIQFGSLPVEILTDHFKDGRWASTLLERYIPMVYPELTWVPGNKDHDHIDSQGNLYDLKCFTKGGLKFMPSNQIGAKRCFDKDVDFAMGQVFDGDSFDEIWRGRAYMDFRQQILKDHNAVDMCRNCSEGYRGMFSLVKEIRG